MMKKIKAGIIGGAGYTGGEMIRLLIHHPNVEIVFVHSNSNADNYVHQIHQDLLGDTDLKFSSEIIKDIDIIFLCVGHGDAKKTLEKYTFSEETVIIDLSQDYRLKAHAEDFVYGLPELNREKIQQTKHIANPGCFATAIQLALLPLASNGKLNSDVHINATTGSSGAGQSLSETSHFSWRNNNVSVYKAFTHQHLNEIGESLHQLQNSWTTDLHFIPQRGAFTRGIFASLYLESDLSKQEAITLYQKYYENHPFTHVSEENIDLKQVVNTNKCLLHIQKQGNQLLILSVIDNLLKGASGQAVQNMNLIFGLDEKTGLQLKASAF